MMIDSDKFVITYRSIRKHPNTNKDYIATDGIISKDTTYRKIIPPFKRTSKHLLFLDSKKEAIKIISGDLKHLNKKIILNGKLYGVLRCEKFSDIKFHKDLVKEYKTLNDARRFITNAVRKTKGKIFGEKPINSKRKHISKDDKPFEIKNDTSKIAKNKCTVFRNILVKDKKTNLYLKVPENGTCYLTTKKNCTLFKNSNQSNYIIKNINSRKFLECYHDMDLIEVYLTTDELVIRNKPECDDVSETKNSEYFDILEDFSVDETIEKQQKTKGKTKK